MDHPQTHSKRKSLSYVIGNFLIIFSLFSLGFLAYPVVKIYTFPPKIQEVSALPSQGTYITIPRINAQAPIIENVDPWNESIYQEALKKGIAHAKSTALPGEEGTVFLFAHSSGPPWEIARINTIFLRLGELKKDDAVYIRHNNSEYVYKVLETKEVEPQDVQYLTYNKDNTLILQTCTPIGTSLRRLLVFAQLSSVK